MTNRVIAQDNDVERDPGAPLGCQVYCVRRTDAGRLPSVPAGTGGCVIRAVVHGDLAAVVGELPTDWDRWTGADLLAYSAVLDAVAAVGPVVPVRFGTVMPDARSVVQDFLAPEEQRLLGLLEQVSGHAQFKLTLSYRDDVALAEIVQGDPEIVRLRNLTRRAPEEAAYGERMRLGQLVAGAIDVKRAAETDALLVGVLPFTAAQNVSLGTGFEHIADCALLVGDDQRAALEDHLEALAASVHPRIRLQWRGPMPPYDFVGVD